MTTTGCTTHQKKGDFQVTGQRMTAYLLLRGRWGLIHVILDGTCNWRLLLLTIPVQYSSAKCAVTLASAGQDSRWEVFL